MPKLILTVAPLFILILIPAMTHAADKLQPPRDAGGSINVEIVGTLRSGVMAIGGETTGTTISALGFTWELDFGDNRELADQARKSDGKEVRVKGPLTVKEGVERGRRVIVQVKELKPIER